MKRKELEENSRLCLDFGKLIKITKFGMKVLPVVVQDWQSKNVLGLVYVNAKALRLTLKKGQAVFWSTSRNELWLKGETSGCTLKIKEVRVNCEQNSLLFLVETANGLGFCHTKDEQGNYRKTCFYRKLMVLELSKASGYLGKALIFLSQSVD
jgi:phosphoribosyl-AMP cyclohydrolase